MKDENLEKQRERILSLIDSEFESDVAFEKAMGLPSKTVNNWRRGMSSSYMKLLPKLSKLFHVNVGELLDMPILRETSELSEDEMRLLSLYRKSRTMPNKLRASLSESLESIINLYLKTAAELKPKKKRSKQKDN
jgi:hypothetical protein